MAGHGPSINGWRPRETMKHTPAHNQRARPKVCPTKQSGREKVWGQPVELPAWHGLNDGGAHHSRQ
eukprot:15466839-Alexandrium_andersonii.AAC.1